MRNTAVIQQVGQISTALPSLKIVHNKKKCADCNKPRKHGKYCYKHDKQHYREKHMDKYTYNALKQNAKRRRKDFQLTFAEFMEFCNITGYLEKKGQSPRDYTIDRINCKEGYSITNIQILTHSENSEKGWKYEKNGEEYPTDEPF